MNNKDRRARSGAHAVGGRDRRVGVIGCDVRNKAAESFEDNRTDPGADTDKAQGGDQSRFSTMSYG